MAHPPRPPMDRASRIQLAAVLLTLILVAAVGVLVVAFPRQLGLPGRPPATPASVVETPAP
jgi:hypothetical protein